MVKIEQLEQAAVEAAMHFKWDEAITLNKRILQMDKNNLEAHLRLGFAYLQKRHLNNAKKFYSKAIKLQPNNNVARENLERLKALKESLSKKRRTTYLNLDPDLFLEVPGKTKSVSLVNLGQKSVLASLSVGQEVILKPKKRKIDIRTKDNEHIGYLPDDLSKRLLVFLKAKSSYTAFIKEALLNRVTVFIKEVKKGKKVQHFLSFPQDIQSHMDELTQEKEDGEENEEIAESDLEKLAEKLTSEEKDYLPFTPETEEEADE